MSEQNRLWWCEVFLLWKKGERLSNWKRKPARARSRGFSWRTYDLTIKSRTEKPAVGPTRWSEYKIVFSRYKGFHLRCSSQKETITRTGSKQTEDGTNWPFGPYLQMSHPGWVMVSLLTELLSSYGGMSKPSDVCANDTTVINALLKDTYNKVRRSLILCFSLPLCLSTFHFPSLSFSHSLLLLSLFFCSLSPSLSQL